MPAWRATPRARAPGRDAASTRFAAAATALAEARRKAAPAFAADVAAELADLGMGRASSTSSSASARKAPRAATRRSSSSVRTRGLRSRRSPRRRRRRALPHRARAVGRRGRRDLVLDEIDAGVGGETAHRVAALLQRLAERAQVLTITHLPQIASVADQHLRVEKVPGRPDTRIAVLDDAERRDELEHARRRCFRERRHRGRAAVSEITGRARLGRRTRTSSSGSGRTTSRSSTTRTSTGSRPRSSPSAACGRW